MLILVLLMQRVPHPLWNLLTQLVRGGRRSKEGINVVECESPSLRRRRGEPTAGVEGWKRLECRVLGWNGLLGKGARCLISA